MREESEKLSLEGQGRGEEAEKLGIEGDVRNKAAENMSLDGSDRREGADEFSGEADECRDGGKAEDLLAVLLARQPANPLDVRDIAPPATLRAVRETISEVQHELKIARADPPARGQPLDAKKGVRAAVGGSRRLRVSLACMLFAARRPDIAARMGGSPARWERIVDMRLSFQLLRTATGMIGERVDLDGKRLLARLTDINERIAAYVKAQAEDATLPRSRRDLLTTLFADQLLLKQRPHTEPQALSEVP